MSDPGRIVQLQDLDLLLGSVASPERAARWKRLGFTGPDADSLRRERERLLAGCDRRWVSLYERSQRRYGRGLTSVRGRVCQGCFSQRGDAGAQRIVQRVLVAAQLAASGCTTLREIPRSQFAARAERKAVRVWTNEGLEYEFDYVRVESDTLTGFLHRNTEGVLDEVAVLHFALPDITRMSARTVDWYRTGVIGGGLLAGVVAAGLSQVGRSSDNGGSSGGGNPRLP